MATLSPGEIELVNELTNDFANVLARELPAIGQSMRRGDAQASFTPTLVFKPVKRQGQIVSYKVELKPRTRIPLETIEHKLSISAKGQLSLFAPVTLDTDEPVA